MASRTLRLLQAVAPVFAAVVIGAASATPAAAVVTGGCKAQATASKSAGADLTTVAEWHLRSDDVVNGSGSAPSEQTSVQIGAYVFGVAIPIQSSTGKGTSASGGPYAVADYSRYVKVIAVSGASTSCAGYVTIIIDDVESLSTAAGIGGLVAGAIGALGLLLTLARGGGALGGLSGLVAGLGFGVLFTQTGALEARSLVGLALPAGGLVVGAVIGRIRSR